MLIEELHEPFLIAPSEKKKLIMDFESLILGETSALVLNCGITSCHFINMTSLRISKNVVPSRIGLYLFLKFRINFINLKIVMHWRKILMKIVLY